jgi:hypothetical protein
MVLHNTGIFPANPGIFRSGSSQTICVVCFGAGAAGQGGQTPRGVYSAEKARWLRSFLQVILSRFIYHSNYIVYLNVIFQ